MCVPTTIRVEFPCAIDTPALREALEAQGLATQVVGEDDVCGLEVGYSVDERDRLFSDVAHAVEGWLAERGMPLVPMRGVDGDCVLRPPAA